MLSTPRAGIPVPQSTDPYRLITDLNNALQAVDALTYPVATPTFNIGAALAVGAAPTMVQTGGTASAPVYTLRLPAGDTINSVTTVGRTIKVTTAGGLSYTSGNVLPQWAIGTVTTGAAGSSASASIGGTPVDPTLSLTIPRGATGAKGDPGNLNVGTTSQILQGDQTWVDKASLPISTATQSALDGKAPASPHIVARSCTSDRTIPSITSTQVNWDKVLGADTGTVPFASNQWTIPQGGVWLIVAQAKFAYLNATTWNLREVRFIVNGSTWDIYSEDRTAAANCIVPKAARLTTGQTFRVEVSQHTGGNLSLTGAQSSVTMQRISD